MCLLSFFSQNFDTCYYATEEHRVCNCHSPYHLQPRALSSSGQCRAREM